jgi:hypothetical protein
MLQAHHNLQRGIVIVNVPTKFAHLDEVGEDALSFFEIRSGDYLRGDPPGELKKN